MVDRDQQTAARLEDSAKLAQRSGPIFQVVEDEGGDHVVKLGVPVRQQVGQVRDTEVGLWPQTFTRKPNHPGASVEAGHLCARLT